MADDINNETPEEKKFSSEDVSKIVKERLERANAGKDELASRLAALEEKHNSLAQAARQVNIAPEQQPIVQGDAPQQAAPEAAGMPLTQDNLQAALTAHQDTLAQNQQAQQFQQASDYHDQTLQGLMGADKEFSDLVTKHEQKVPRAVAIHVSNNFEPEAAKKIFQDLLSNEHTNLKMKNAYLEELQQPDTGAYQKWLGQLMKQNSSTPSDNKAPSPVPELQGGENTSDGDEDMEGIMNYMNQK